MTVAKISSLELGHQHLSHLEGFGSLQDMDRAYRRAQQDMITQAYGFIVPTRTLKIDRRRRDWLPQFPKKPTWP